MKSLILASASPQRKKLLQLLGLNFKIDPSHSKELKRITSTCAQLVKDNARIKAKDVARRYKTGIVIGSDTVVYVGGKHLIGKPRDLKEAKKNLKILMAHPHWVYTGVAVIDVENNKMLIDYEKTKIFMTKLPDDAIDRYYQHMSPLDKAGGFDIEGRGSVFIRRIEGCYFNVVGLPLAKLSLMLNKVGFTVLGVLMMLSAFGCTTEYNLATNRQENLMYGVEKEKSIGAAISQQIEKESKIVNDVDVNDRVQGILDRIVAVCDRKELIYTIRVIDEDKMNAVSLPGGYIYLFKGLIDKVDNDDQLASVVAHEIGHITAKHSMKRLQAMYGATILQVMSIATRDGRVASGVNAAIGSAMMEYSRDDELEADKLGVKYLKAAGYNVDEMAGMLKKLKKEEEKEPIRPISYWRTHPYLSQRIAAVNQIVKGQLEFRDYLNLIGE